MTDTQTKQDDEQTLLIIAAIVLAFFTGLTAWLMAPGFFAQEQAAKAAAIDSTASAPSVLLSDAASTQSPSDATPRITQPVAPQKLAKQAPALNPTPVASSPTTPVASSSTTPVASSPKTPVAASALVAATSVAAESIVATDETLPSPELFVETSGSTVTQPPAEVIDPPLPEPAPSVVETPTATDQQMVATDQQMVATIAEASSVVSFYTASIVLTDESKTVLDKVAALMDNNPTKRLGIIGHTDALGDADSNVELSFARARACAAYLADKGVASARIDAAGMGEQMPLASNQTEQGRERNRRVEFRLL